MKCMWCGRTSFRTERMRFVSLNYCWRCEVPMRAFTMELDALSEADLGDVHDEESWRRFQQAMQELDDGAIASDWREW